VARQRRMRGARPTISSIGKIVERASLTRRCRATLSQRERERLQITHFYLVPVGAKASWMNLILSDRDFPERRMKHDLIPAAIQ